MAAIIATEMERQRPVMDSLTNELSQIGNHTYDTNETDVGPVKLKSEQKWKGSVQLWIH